MWQMSMWQLVARVERCINLNVMHQGGKLYYYPNSDGKINGEYTGHGRAIKLGNYNPCGARHEANATDGFYDGFVDYNKNGRQDKGEGVIVWRGSYGLNGHATTYLDMSKWQTAKS